MQVGLPIGYDTATDGCQKLRSFGKQILIFLYTGCMISKFSYLIEFNHLGGYVSSIRIGNNEQYLFHKAYIIICWLLFLFVFLT